MKKHLCALAVITAIILLAAADTFSQISINNDGSAPDNSAMLDIKSTTRGVLFPRLTQAERNAIVNPSAGLTIYQTDGVTGLYYNSGSPYFPMWLLVGNNSGPWQANPYGIHFIAGAVGIGKTDPLANLDVNGSFMYSNSTGYPFMMFDLISPYAAGHAGLRFTSEGNYRSYIYFDGYDSLLRLNCDYAGGWREDLVIRHNGNVGIATSNPEALFHVAKKPPRYTAMFGDNITGYFGGTNVAIGDNSATSVFYIGQDTYYKGFCNWIYNANPSYAYFALGSYGGQNPLILQDFGGNVGIGTTSPASRLQVNFNNYGQNHVGYSAMVNYYSNHTESVDNGDGQAAVYGYRNRLSQNDGFAYTPDGTNSGTKGYSFWGDLYSFGVAGFNYNDYTRCGGVLGADIVGTSWGSLGYKNSAGTYFGGYFTTSGSGAGKSPQTNIGVGIGAWGDLLGADIHGKIYGVFAEGQDYALYTNGPVYKNNIDVHLQKNASGANNVLYTHVSTDATVQTSGQANISAGKATIAFDAAFAAVVSAESPIIVTVTPTGNSNGVYLAEVSKTGFSVVENNDGKSNVTINYIAIGKRAGYEHPELAGEVVDAAYTGKIAVGLHNDADLSTNGKGLYYEGGKLTVGIHPSTLPDPNKPPAESVIPKKSAPEPIDLSTKSASMGKGGYMPAPTVEPVRKSTPGHPLDRTLQPSPVSNSKKPAGKSPEADATSPQKAN